MAEQIRWSKPLCDLAKAEGKALWAVGYDGKAGRWQAWGKMDDDQARKVWMFVTLVYKGRTPAEAFDEAKLGEATPP